MYYFVTRGSRGIGAGIVEQAVSAGHDVAFTYVRNKDAADAVVARCRELREDAKVAVKPFAKRVGWIDRVAYTVKTQVLEVACHPALYFFVAICFFEEDERDEYTWEGRFFRFFAAVDASHSMHSMPSM